MVIKWPTQKVVSFLTEQSLRGTYAFFIWVGCVKSCYRLHNAMCNFTRVALMNQTDMFKLRPCNYSRTLAQIPIQIVVHEIDVNFCHLGQKMTCYCSAIVADYSTFVLTEQFISIFVNRYNPTNNLSSYFGLFGKTVRQSHLK